MGFWGNFFGGKSSKYEQKSMLTPEQMRIQNQLNAAAQGRGAGGAWGDVSDYYRNLLSNESPDAEAFQAPAMRQFNEQIIPGLSEQFAGMGAGGSGLSGSSFRNAAIGAGTDLSERLASMRAGLRQQAATGLQDIGTQALKPYTQNVFRPQQPSPFGQAIGAAAGAFGSSFLGGFGGAGADWAKNIFNTQTKGSPNSVASPQNPGGYGYNPYTGQQGNQYVG